jgi:hypothetical protein
MPLFELGEKSPFGSIRRRALREAVAFADYSKGYGAGEPSFPFPPSEASSVVVASFRTGGARIRRTAEVNENQLGGQITLRKQRSPRSGFTRAGEIKLGVGGADMGFGEAQFAADDVGAFHE